MNGNATLLVAMRRFGDNPSVTESHSPIDATTPPPVTRAAAAPSRLDRVIIALCAAVMVACVLLVWQRDAVRAWWWTRALAVEPSVERRVYYITMLAGLGHAAAPAVCDLATHADPGLRVTAAQILAHTPSPVARDSLIGLLADAEVDVRDAAAQSLAFGHGAAAIDALVDALSGALGRDRAAEAEAACIALGQIPEEAAVLPLIDAARDARDPMVRAQAAEMLGIRREMRAEPVLLGLLNDPRELEGDTYELRRRAPAMAFAGAQQGMSPAASRPAPRTVAQVAAEALDRIRDAAESAASHPSASSPAAASP